jgi:hypothetical protein
VNRQKSLKNNCKVPVFIGLSPRYIFNFLLAINLDHCSGVKKKHKTLYVSKLVN